jgi:site-specific DNA recombinase
MDHRCLSGCSQWRQIHRLLTNPIYKGDYVYNRKADEEQRITVAIPAIISASTFDAVQLDLSSRNPRVTPPRVVNGPILLSGVAHCSGCGARLVVTNGTGRGGDRFYYYKCGARHGKSKVACTTEKQIPLPQLDDLVTRHLAEHVLAPDRLSALLASLLKRQTAKDHERAAHLSAMKERLAKATKGIGNFYAAIEAGMIDLSDPLLRGPMEGLQRERKLAEQAIDRALAEISPDAQITEERLASFSNLMRRNLQEGTIQFRRDYIRALVENVIVSDTEVRISVDVERLGQSVMRPPEQGVRSFVRTWRKRWDSNPRYGSPYASFQDWSLQPLGHASFPFRGLGAYDWLMGDTLVPHAPRKATRDPL